jgi:hypothetical protein
MADLLGSLIIPAALLLTAWLIIPHIWRGVKAIAFLPIEYRERAAHAQQLEAEAGIVRLPPGQVVVPYRLIERVIAAQFQAQGHYHSTMAMPANVPHTMTYAPHIRQLGNGAPQLEAAQENTPPAVEIDRRDFWQLYHADELPENGFCLGWDMTTGQKIIAGWDELYNVLVGGVSRSGKSTLIRSVLAQAAIQGSRFVVIDKHFGAGEDSMGASLLPLRPLMLTDIAATEAQQVNALRLVRNVANARLTGRDKSRSPLVLVIDETTGLLLRSNIAKELIDLLSLLTIESAKVKVFAICIGHQWTSEILPTAVRNSFVSAISCRARRDTARVMSGSIEFAKLAADLKPPGQAVWMMPSGDIVQLSVPNCTAHHIELVAREVSTGVGKQMVPSFPHRESSTPNEAGGIITESLLPLDSKALRAIELLKTGREHKEIIGEVWGETTGRRYMDASAEFLGIIRDYVCRMENQQ